MVDSPRPRSPLDSFLDVFWKDFENDALRPLAEYLERFPGQDADIAREYRAAIRPGVSDDDESDDPSLNRIGPYRTIRQIGRGGQATVYLAEDTRLPRQVALKVLDPGGRIDPTALSRFRREAEITSKLDHPGICTVYETGEAAGILWIAMRYIDGESLASKISIARDRLAPGEATLPTMPERPDPGTDAIPVAGDSSGPKTWTEIVRILAIFEDVASALHVAHEAGVIHRDIKPGNLIITKEGEPVILDFGLAQETTGDHSALTLTGELMGTPAYMSPEQIAAQRIRLDRRTDVYSLGVSLYECLTLRRPFDSPTWEGLYQAILTKDPPPPRELNPSLPADLRIVLESALEKDRDRRYQTAAALAEDLRRIRMREPILAKPAGTIVRLQRWSQRNPALATAVIGLFVLLAAGLTIALVLLGKVTRADHQKTVALDAVTTERNEKETALADYDRLGDLSRLQGLVAEASTLWPAGPSKVPALRSWLTRAALLEKRLAGHTEVRDRLRMSAIAESRPASQPADSQAAAREDPPAWKFETPAEQFKHDTTAKLVADLAAFLDPDPKKGLLAGMKNRLAFAETVEEETVGKRHAQWAEAFKSISDPTQSPQYKGLKIATEIGLVPIGKDPASGLWEFAHLQTTAPGTEPVPTRGQDGRLVVTEATGLVFVLIPGGSFRMGAARPDDDQGLEDPNVDPEALANESPITEVTLDPFYLSKYEMTQGQWLRITGRNRSAYGPGAKTPGMARDAAVDLRHPVEQVSWDDCDLWLGRLGLVLPTEAQWEYAARAGTATPRWTGVGTDGLGKAANVADQSARRQGGFPTWTYESWDDGFTLHAPVGSLAPNPFGLHDVLGNVWEWCRDWSGDYTFSPDPGDGLRHPPRRARVLRGGSWSLEATLARSAARTNFTPNYVTSILGVRPAKLLSAP